jgi:Holliday junction DNA helicase RuvA
MIIAIEGEVIKKEPTLLHIQTGAGLTYSIRVSLHCSSKIDSKSVRLHTSYIVKEDSHTLFGFLDEGEKSIFDRVLKINGVGPSTALAICSTFTPDKFYLAINNQDIDALKSVPGIGPKSAKRILVELSDFKPGIEESGLSDAMSEAKMALESLGFKRDKIVKVLKVIKAQDTQTIIKEALKELSK